MERSLSEMKPGYNRASRRIVQWQPLDYNGAAATVADLAHARAQSVTRFK
jgi:hypothetical protein